MPAKHCAHGKCNRDNRYMERPDMVGEFFISFPKPHRDMDKCVRWMRACSREGFTTEKVTKYTYICSWHFVGGKGPTSEHPDPIPANYTPDQAAKFGRKRKGPMVRPPPPCKRPLLPGSGAEACDEQPMYGLSLLAACALPSDHNYSVSPDEELVRGVCGKCKT